MTRNYDKDSGMGGIMQAFLIGAIIGAVGVFFSDDRNRRRARATMDDWKHKAEDAGHELSDRAQDLKREGLQRVSEELDKTQKKVDSKRRNA